MKKKKKNFYMDGLFLYNCESVLCFDVKKKKFRNIILTFKIQRKSKTSFFY